MTTTTCWIDHPSARRLADLDPALRLLPRLLTGSANGSAPGLHDVRWTAGAGCRLVLVPPPADGVPTFVGVEISSASHRAYDFRDDPALPGVAEASDPETVARLVAPVLDTAVTGCAVLPVRYRPGSRAVLRYDLQTPEGPVSLHAKTTRNGAHAGAAAAVAELTVGEWPALHLHVTRTVTGRSASAVLTDPAIAAMDRLRVARRLGALLGDFHAPSGPAAPADGASTPLEDVRSLLGTVARVDRGLARRLGEALAALEPGPSEPGPVVRCHGSFRAGQVVVTDAGALVLLDLDHVGPGDAGHDLGTALAHLTWRAITHPHAAPVLRSAEEAVLGGYAEVATLPSAPCVAWWHTLGLLQIAVRRYRRLEVADWPRVPALVDAAEAMLASTQTSSASRPRPPVPFSTGPGPVLDAGRLTQLLRRVVHTDDHHRCPITVVSVREVRRTPGRRCVVSYTVRGLPDNLSDDLPGDLPDDLPERDRVEPDQLVELVGKTFDEPGRAELLYDHLRRLSDGPFRAGDLRVPRPVALLPEQHLVLYRPVTGTSLDRIQDVGRLDDGVRRAARWLARLHGSRVVLPRHLSLEREQLSSREWAGLVARRCPQLAVPARRLADRWPTGLAPLPAGAERPLHKDFHPGHVLVGAALSVIDLDEARMGDPAFDVAHFCTYLELFHPDRPALRATFLSAYDAASAGADAAAVPAFCAYTWLKIAKQAAAGSGPFRHRPAAERTRATGHALTKGLQCLSE